MKKILSKIFFLLLIFSSYSFSDDKSIIKKLDGLNFPVQIIKNEQISNNSIFVLEHRPGAIIEIENIFDQNSEKKINKILDLSSIITDVDNWEQGVLSFAFSPNFSNDNLVFVSNNNKNNQLVLSSFQYEHSSKTIPISTEEVILKIDRIFDESLIKNEHTCGTIKFHPIDNFLYLCTGDARSPELSQDFQSLNGKILRIDPFTLNKAENKKYKSPEKNPYIKINGRPEIVFAGLRNPWAFCFEGGGVMNTLEGNVEIVPGSFVLHPPGELHEYANGAERTLLFRVRYGADMVARIKDWPTNKDWNPTEEDLAYFRN